MKTDRKENEKKELVLMIVASFSISGIITMILIADHFVSKEVAGLIKTIATVALVALIFIAFFKVMNKDMRRSF